MLIIHPPMSWQWAKMEAKENMRCKGLFMVLAVMAALTWGMDQARAKPSESIDWQSAIQRKAGRVTQAEREAAAERLAAARLAAALQGSGDMAGAAGEVSAMAMPMPGDPPHYFGPYPNWAFSPPIKKFVDWLPEPGPGGVNNLGQYIPIANSDTTTYPGSDYYEIALVQDAEKMHSDLPPTTFRGYVQLNNGTDQATNLNTILPAPVHYLGPMIVAQKDRPVRIKFTNLLPTGVDGDLFIPVDTTVMGAGMGPDGSMYTENRATVHLHGGRSPWISDGTPHQWITPAGEATSYPKGVSVVNVPDMPDPGPGSMTFYWSNQQSGRLMFYHDHAYGITRLNVYVGEAAPYLIQDATEQALVDAGIIPVEQIPLVIQDKTFVDADTIMMTDPTWSWGSVPGTPMTGDLWMPHVYMTAQNPYDISGVNPFGRWHYGPWFWPPTTNVTYGPVPNPYYDPVEAPWEPPYNPGVPHPSMGMESFFDTPVVNGTAFPVLQVEPRAYRFRVLNAANDRFWNLQLYVADPDVVTSDFRTNTEVRMVPAAPGTGLPPSWPTDGREGGVPDPTMVGPDWIQIGSEGGFLPAPAVIANQPITWNLDPTTFNFGNVQDHSLLLGSAERADVIVDFSLYAGETLILYNDAPTAFPALDPRTDYYTGAPDMSDTGGHWGPQAGFGPNTRTVMQIQVLPNAPAPPFNLSALEAAFASTGTSQGVFAASQDPIIVGQSAYNSAYNTTFPTTWPTWGYVNIQDNTMSFQTVAGETVTDFPLEPKAIQDEMGEAFEREYGRMSGFFGVELPFTAAGNQNFVLYPYSSPPVEVISPSIAGTPIGSLGDGTQIWKITHNGVDTHPVHFHLYDVQLINRVGWDGAISLPDDNELGWKETVRVSPLEDTIVALRPILPTLPFRLPNSIRPIDPTMPLGAMLADGNLNEAFDPNGEPVTIFNHLVNYGWEYMIHCHILSHEEMDMMHAVAVAVPPDAPSDLAATVQGSKATLTWTDNSVNETQFTIERAADPAFTTGLVSVTVGPDETTYTDSTSKNNQTYYYRVQADNVVGDTADYSDPQINEGAVGFPYKIASSAFSNTVMVGAAVDTPPAAPTSLTVTLQTGPQILVTWQDNARNESGFAVERADNGGPFVAIAAPGPRNGTGSVSYTDTTVMAGNTYDYRVMAINGAGSSAYSNTAGMTVPAAPAAPSGLTATASRVGNGNNDRITLNWTDNSDNETGFSIQRSTSQSFTTNLVTSTVGANVTTFQTGNVPRNMTYWFRVQSVGAAGASAWSDAVSVTTP